MSTNAHEANEKPSPVPLGEWKPDVAQQQPAEPIVPEAPQP